MCNKIVGCAAASGPWRHPKMVVKLAAILDFTQNEKWSKNVGN